MSYYKYTRNT